MYVLTPALKSKDSGIVRQTYTHKKDPVCVRMRVCFNTIYLQDAGDHGSPQMSFMYLVMKLECRLITTRDFDVSYLALHFYSTPDIFNYYRPVCVCIMEVNVYVAPYSTQMNVVLTFSYSDVCV